MIDAVVQDDGDKLQVIELNKFDQSVLSKYFLDILYRC